jgi:3-hydroxyisobutyrate dehydrogenase-like beta-hydroxyacid dehydrogenase
MSGIGFVGLGVMGEPMCRNLATKSGYKITAFDLQDAPLKRLAAYGVVAAADLVGIVTDADFIFLVLPSGKHLEDLCRRPGGLLKLCKPGQTIIDCGTSPVDLTRQLARDFANNGVHYADAPIARTRHAAEEGTLSIMVGTEPTIFERVKPLLACCGSDITYCGTHGAGQVLKLMNNMVVVETVVAISEALNIARRAGVDGTVLFETMAKGSADSFPLRNHGMKSVLPGEFPTRSFSTEYMLKDMTYACALAEQTGAAIPGALVGVELLRKTIAAGYGDRYWPALSAVLASEQQDGAD